MKVYIELVIADNFAITYLLARLTYYAMGRYPKKLRLIAASVLGAIAALINPLISGTIFSIGYKIVCGAVICAVLFFKVSPIKGSLLFFMFTFTFGGALFACAYFVFGSAERALTEPLTSVPIGVSLFAAYILFMLLRGAILKMFKRRDLRGFIYNAEITLFGKSVECKAFLDSGNRLYDNVSGLPIVVVNMSTVSKILSDDKITQLISGKMKDFKRGHYVDYRTLGGQAKLPVFVPDELVVYDGDKKNIINEVMLGVSFKRISDVEKYGLILNPAVMMGA